MIENPNSKISGLTIERLTLYLRALNRLKALKVENVVSRELSDMLGISAFIIRKDISQFGQFGSVKSGYNVNELIENISNILGVKKSQDAVIIGAGNLGKALMGYRSFAQYDFNIRAAFDIDDNKIKKEFFGIKCLNYSELEKYLSENSIKIGIITVPDKAAQDVADTLVKLGVKGILNFSPVVLKVPKYIKLIDVDFISRLQILSYYIKEKR